MANIAATNITSTFLYRRRNNGLSYNNVQLAFGNGTLTYPSGGVPVTAATFGLINVIQSAVVFDQGASGFDWQFDVANSKLRCFQDRAQDWVAFTPTGSWVSNTTYTGFAKVLGDTVMFAVKIALAGAPTSAALTVTLPAAYVIDTAKVSSATADAVPLGYGGGKHSAAFQSYQVSQSATANSVDVFFLNSISTAGLTAVTQAAPFTFANGDEINLLFQAPCTGFGGLQLNGQTEPVGVAIAAQTLKCEVIGW